MDSHPIGGLIVISCLTLFHAIVTAAKVSLENINEATMEKQAQEGRKQAQRVIKLSARPDRYINLMKLVSATVCILIGIIYISEQYAVLAEMVKKNQLLREYPVAFAACAALMTAILIYVIVLLGFLLPKKLGLRYADSFACRLSKLLSCLITVFTPLLWLFEKNIHILLRLFGIHPSELEENVTEDEIISMVNEGQEQGVLEAEEAEMISNIIEFDEKEANDIMTHRKKIIAVSTELSIEEALRFMLNESFSRFPLYQDDIDNIVGILHLKDVARYFMNEKLRYRPLIEAAREPYFIPDTLNIDVLFRDMQLKKIHMAVAIDEYGQTAGIVAMEDLLEEIVGDIQDEYDDEEDMIIEELEGSYLIHGEADLEEVGESTGIEFEEEDLDNFDTINGFLISRLEHIPEENETTQITYSGFEFQIIKVEHKVIRLVRMSRLPKEGEIPKEGEVLKEEEIPKEEELLKEELFLEDECLKKEKTFGEEKIKNKEVLPADSDFSVLKGHTMIREGMKERLLNSRKDTRQIYGKKQENKSEKKGSQVCAAELTKEAAAEETAAEQEV